MKKDEVSNCVPILLREMVILSKVNHPNVLSLTHVVEMEDTLYIFTPLLCGGELFEHISQQESGFSEKQASWMMRCLLQALAYLHNMGICHRDVKPENLMLKDGGDDAELQLVDFGISRYVLAGDKAKTMTGTPFYVSPEIVKLTSGIGDGYGCEVDMWAAGVVMYILLCGFPPFQADALPDMLDLIQEGDYSFPGEWLYSPTLCHART